MRTGAIFARGSCRALKWMALVGVVFALGAGSAAAQITITVAEEVDEGARVPVTVGGTISVPASTVAGTTVTISGAATSRAGSGTVTAGDADDTGTWANLVLTLPVTDADGAIPEHPVTGTLYWQVGVDLDAEDEAIELTFTSSDTTNAPLAADAASKNVTIDDAQTQSFEWGSVPKLKEAGTAMITLTANPAPTPLTPGGITHPTTLVVEGATGYTISPASHTFTDGAGASVEITITAPTNDSNRADDEIMLRALEAGTVTNRADPVSITVTDIHELPATADITMKAYDSDESDKAEVTTLAGDPVYIEVTVDRGTDGYPTGEKLKVTLAATGATLAKTEVEIAFGTGEEMSELVMLTPTGGIVSGSVTVTATVEGATAANGTNTVTGTPLMLSVSNPAAKMISAKDDAAVAMAVTKAMGDGDGDDNRWSPGEDLMLMVGDLFTDGDGTPLTQTPTLSVSSDKPAVASVTSSGQNITVNAVGLGTAMIRVTASVDPNLSTAIPQTSAYTAAVEFSAEVVASLPGTPDAPTVRPEGRYSDQGDRWYLRASWEAPDNDDGGSLTYDLRYRHEDDDEWSMTDAWSGNSLADIETLTQQFVVTPAGGYEVQVRATNSVGDSAWSMSGEGDTGANVLTDDPKGQLVKVQLTSDAAGASPIVPTTIGGVPRVHVQEGSSAYLAVTARWTHAEVTELRDELDCPEPQTPSNRGLCRVTVLVRTWQADSRRYALPEWLSWIDGDQDIDFANLWSDEAWYGGSREAQVDIIVPKLPPVATRYSTRDVVSATGTSRIRFHEDDEAENDAFYVEASASRHIDLNAAGDSDRTTPLVVIEDNDLQGLRVQRDPDDVKAKGTEVIYESSKTATWIVQAVPPRYDLPLEVRLDLLDSEGLTVRAAKLSLDRASLTLNRGTDYSGGDPRSGQDNQGVSLHLPASDGDRKNDEYSLKASVVVYSLSSGGYDTIEAANVPFEVIDVHHLPVLMVSSDMTEVKEGGEVELTLTINRNPGDTIAAGGETRRYTSEAVDVMLTAGAGSTAGMADYQLPATVNFAKHDGKSPWTQEMKVKVMAQTDNELDDGEMLVLDAMVAGTEPKNGTDKTSYSGVASLTIGETTAKLVWAKTQEEVEAAIYAARNAGMGDDMTLNPGEMIEVMGSALFNAAEGVTLSYSAMTSDDNVASTAVDSAGTAMVTAKGAGMADITITAHASMPSGVKILDQTDPTEASIMFQVEVGLEALSIMLSGPEDMDLVEGGMGAMVTATANRAVTADTKVMLMRDRAMSSAGDDDYMADPITITAGAMTGSTMVMAVEDNMMEDMEELVLYGMTEGMAGEVTGEVHLHLWDAAVPALPVIAQLLLAAFLAVGGYRRYRRR